MRDLTFVERAGLAADRAREVETRAGLRPWRVFVVMYQWSGGERFRGEPELIRCKELTPRPLVTGENVTKQAKMAGTTHEGSITLKEISARYTEDDLDLLFQNVDASQEVFIEVRNDDRDGSQAARKLYRPTGQPVRNPEGLEWTLRLERAVDDRTRQGTRRDWSEQ